MDKNITIKNNIRELRFFADEMTQKELAEKAGVSRQTIIAIEAGKYNPSLKFGLPDRGRVWKRTDRSIHL